MINSDFGKRRVVIYARVSTEHEAQISALENQLDWYEPILAARPEWELVGRYIDEGITGTSAEKRPQFMKMIRDAKQKKFDMIITREVSRFARNTVDTLQYTRDLKAKGIEVFFINDNIKTFDGDGELRLTIMATLAQDESRKTSVRVKSGQQTSMNNGTFYGNGNILGYRRHQELLPDNKKKVDFIIDPEQAETVRLIYEMYLAGNGLTKIKEELERRGRKTAMGKTRWYETVIGHVLKNTFYCGIITYHKEYTPDYLTQKKIKNYGEIDLIQVKGRHEPIITEEQFERVQLIMASKTAQMKNLNTGRRSTTGKRPRTTVWGKLLICECGHRFNTKLWRKEGDKSIIGYQCYDSVRTGSYESRKKKGLPLDGICRVPMIPEWKLQMMANYIFRNYLSEKDKVLALANSMLEAHIDDKEDDVDYEAVIEKKCREVERHRTKLSNFIDMRAEGEIDKESYTKKTAEVKDEIAKLSAEIEEIQLKLNKEPVITDYKDKLTVLQYALEQYTNADEKDIPESVIEAFVVKIVVRQDGFDWYLRFDGDPNDPLHMKTEGKRRKNSSVSVVGGKLPTKQNCDTGGGTGVMTNYNYSYETPWDDYHSAIRKVIIGNGVTKIGKNAFATLYHLTGVTISESVTSIGEYAFYGCHSLTSIAIPDSVTNIGMYAFDSCTLLEEVKMGNNVTTIGDCAFRGCELVESITIPGSVTNIGVSVFSDCNKLILELEKDSCAETYALDNNIPYYYLYDAGEENIITVTVNSNLSFKIDKETCTMTVNCLGEMGSFEIGNAPWASYEPYVKHVIISEGCKSIGANAFCNFEGIEDVVCANSIATIGDYAFYNCWNLTSVIKTEELISIGDYAFYNCSKLSSLSIPKAEISVGDYAFYNCSNLASFTSYDGITNVGDYSFYGCSSLAGVTINNKATTIGKCAFYGCASLASVTIPDSVKTIGHYAFYECTSLKEMIIPDSVTTIGIAAFRFCSGIEDMVIGNTVKNINSSAFRDCISLANITIPDSVTFMDEAVFKNCSGLKNITLSDNIDTINKSMFYECTGLTDIVIPDGVTSIGNDAFYGCSSLANVTIPDSVTSIESEAFYNCISLTDFVIPKGVTTISASVFVNCKKLANITISNSVTIISSSAFENCTSLTNITIPDSVTVIGNYAFYRCSSLVSVYLPISVLSVGGYSFSNCNKLEKLRIYNPNCYFETDCISNNTIICGYSGSTAETYAKEKGYKFELITEGDHEHVYSNSCDSECNICGYVNLNAGHTYKTVVHNPTCQNGGFTVCICTVCKYAYVSEITDPVDHDMRWVMATKPTSSADGVKNYSCSYCGLVEDTKVVPAFLISDNSVANIDFDSNTISGFDAGATSIDDYVSVETDGYSFVCDSAVIGTGTVIELTDGDTVITEFTAVIFGDVNGDGWYDGTDSIIISCFANGLLSKDDVSPAFYTAADCNHDGVIDSFDVALLEQAGLLLSNVDQSKSNEELATDEAFIEYLDLIDQTPEDETVEDEVIETPEAEEFSIFEFIIEMIKKFIEFILAHIPVPYK